ncbi:GTPase [Buchnera aphidicola]|uniref:GTPase n=1 Tax=Buchnera aphidicola TaxID=9 RepID=UPI0009E5D262|nr:GTPase [Buchnera aphidicola]
MNKEKKYCGHVLLVGRTNVGKSTILNKIVKKNISITSNKSNTTKEHIIGIHTTDTIQSILIDSPGLKKNKNSFLEKKKTEIHINI